MDHTELVIQPDRGGAVIGPSTELSCMGRTVGPQLLQQSCMTFEDTEYEEDRLREDFPDAAVNQAVRLHTVQRLHAKQGCMQYLPHSKN